MAKDKSNKKPKVHADLEGFDIKINESGEIESTHSIDQLNDFLNKKVVDKKLKDREDLNVIRNYKEGEIEEGESEGDLEDEK